MPLTSVVPSEPRKLQPWTDFMVASREPTRSASRWAESSLIQVRPPAWAVAAAGTVVVAAGEVVVVVLSAEAGAVVAAREPATTATVVTNAAPAPACQRGRLR